MHKKYKFSILQILYSTNSLFTHMHTYAEKINMLVNKQLFNRKYKRS